MADVYQMTLPLQGLDSPNADTRNALLKAKLQLGFVPNMYGAMGNSAALLETYMDGYDRFRKDPAFSAAEQEVVFLTISCANRCTYCVAAHSTLADRMSKVPPEVTDSIRDAKDVPHHKLAALSTFVGVMFHTRGMPSPEQASAFFGAGYDERHMLSIVLAIAVKTISNYANHLFRTPVDAMFSGRAWTPPAR